MKITHYPGFRRDEPEAFFWEHPVKGINGANMHYRATTTSLKNSDWFLCRLLNQIYGCRRERDNHPDLPGLRAALILYAEMFEFEPEQTRVR